MARDPGVTRALGVDGEDLDPVRGETERADTPRAAVWMAATPASALTPTVPA